MDKITVNLYGGKGIFGGRETPLRAEIVYCDKHNSCALYKNGCCLNVTAPFSCKCKFGRIETVKGYTSRAMKYHEFRHRYTSDAVYGKLNYPKNCKVVLINNYVFIDVTFAKVVKNENGECCINSTGFGSGASWVEEDKLTVDLLYRLCTYRPQAIMGGTIQDYANKKIPEMLFQLKREMPEFYKDFVTEHPEFDYEPDYVGKTAYINTLVKGCTVTEDRHDFKFDGEYLICDKYKYGFMPFDAPAYIKIKVTDDMKCKITSNSQVDENTMFEL